MKCIHSIVWFCEWATVVLALIGIITLGNVMHEMVHYSDVVKQNATVISVCFLKLPLDYNKTNNETWLSGSAGEVQASGDVKSPEWKALTIGFVFMLILLVIAIIGFWIGESDNGNRDI